MANPWKGMSAADRRYFREAYGLTEGKSKMKRKGSKKSNKHYPVQRKITMGVALPSTPDTTFLIRTDKLLSNVNHRLYRQSRVYNVKVDIDTDLADGSTVQVYALADTWYNMKAYQLAKQIFDENSKEERELLSTTNARWNDFRVDHGETIAQELEAIQFTGAVGTRFTAGEYELSEIADASGTSQTFRWVGSGANTFNIIDEYDITGNTDATPTNAISSVAYDGVTDELDDAQMLHLSSDGDIPPYDRNSLENQAWVLVGTLYIRATGTNKLSTGFFNAPCGLIRLSTSGGLEANSLTENIHIEVKGGDYKGVHAPSYLE